MARMEAAGGGAKGARTRLASSRGGGQRARRSGRAPSAPSAVLARSELERANAGKNGHPFVYPSISLDVICRIRRMTGLSFRKMEMIAAALFGNGNAPDYSTLCRRFNKIEAARGKDGAVVVGNGGRTLVYMPDVAGIGPSKAGKWRSYVHKSGVSLLTLEIVTGVDGQKIRAVRITEKRGEKAPFRSIVDRALGSAGKKRDRRRPARADGGEFVVICRHDGGETSPGAAARLAGEVDSMIVACRNGDGG